MRKFGFLFVLLISVGCARSIDPGTKPEAIDYTGTVTLGGKPVEDAVLNLQVIDKGTQATIPVVKGEFKAKLTPGTYTYYLTQGKNAAWFKNVPEKFQSGAMDRKLVLNSSTTTLTITFE